MLNWKQNKSVDDIVKHSGFGWIDDRGQLLPEVAEGRLAQVCFQRAQHSAVTGLLAIQHSVECHQAQPADMAG